MFAACAALCVFSLGPEWVIRLCANYRHSVDNPHGFGIGGSLIRDPILFRHAKLIAGNNYDLILVAARVLRFFADALRAERRLASAVARARQSDPVLSVMTAARRRSWR